MKHLKNLPHQHTRGRANPKEQINVNLRQRPGAQGDSLLTVPGYRVDYIMTNPPFGQKSSLTFTNEEGKQEEEDLVYNRQDFWTTRSNKQLNFVQHINTILKATGKAAVVVPDNVLFEGGTAPTGRMKFLSAV